MNSTFGETIVWKDEENDALVTIQVSKEELLEDDDEDFASIQPETLTRQAFEKNKLLLERKGLMDGVQFLLFSIARSF